MIAHAWEIFSMNRRPLIPLVVLVSASMACNNEGYRLAPVSGRVTLDGKGVANVAVLFQPMHSEGNYAPGPGSTGVTDADGRFSLKTIKESRGAVVGKHKVRFTMFEGPGAVKTNVRVPAKYNDREGKLEFDVPPEGISTADFALTSQ
jgi:hypothetical protein